MNTPHKLSQKAIEEFKTAYQEEFGQTLSDNEVQEMALRLLRFFNLPSKSSSPDYTIKTRE